MDSANIISSLSTHFGGLGENQVLNQTINGNCTELYFQVYSPDLIEQLTMYADGPCKDAAASIRKVNINFLPCKCPIGFQPKTSNFEVNQTRCECECDKRLNEYITSCDPNTHTVVRKGNVWITYLNLTNNRGYLIYTNCPLDYCYAPGILTTMNLNLPNGSDAQCSNRISGLFCGRCKPGLSLLTWEFKVHTVSGAMACNISNNITGLCGYWYAFSSCFVSCELNSCYWNT